MVARNRSSGLLAYVLTVSAVGFSLLAVLIGHGELAAVEQLPPVFWALVRTPVEKRDMVAIQRDVEAEAVVWRIVEAQLASRRFIEGDQFTIADIALGAYARRWLGVEGVSKPKLPNLERWFAQFAERRGFTQFIAPPMT